MELREVHKPNDGRDPFPVLIGRHKVPKNRSQVPSTYPSISMELTNHEVKEYFTPRDFSLADTLYIYGRKFLIYDADNFTKAFYYKNFGLTEFKQVDVEQRKKPLPKMVSTLDISISLHYTKYGNSYMIISILCT